MLTPLTGPHDPRFQESEAAQILERAAELQRLASDARRMSVGELEEAAAVAGIDASFVRRAAGEMALRQAGRERATPTLGAPRTLVLEVVLDGEIPVRAYEYVIEAIRRHTGELGVASLIGRSLTWTALPKHGPAGPRWSRTIALTVVPHGGRTRVRIEEKLDHLVRGVFGAAAGSGSGGALLSTLPLAALSTSLALALALPLTAAACVGAWIVARQVYRARVDARARELDGAMQAISTIAQSYAKARALARATPKAS